MRASNLEMLSLENEVILLPILDFEFNNHLEDLSEERNGGLTYAAL